MKHLLMAVTVSLFMVGCVTQHETNFEAMHNAQQMIRDGKAECVLIPEEGEIIVQRGRGVTPLLWMYDTHPAEMEGGTICDKVIGRATAAIAICGKVRHVHSELMSDDAVEFLEAYGITTSATKRVPRILNRKMDGLCPMEQAVEQITDPEEAVAQLRETLAKMKQ